MNHLNSIETQQVVKALRIMDTMFEETGITIVENLENSEFSFDHAQGKSLFAFDEARRCHVAVTAKGILVPHKHNKGWHLESFKHLREEAV